VGAGIFPRSHAPRAARTATAGTMA
jgi:hypothetical protein